MGALDRFSRIAGVAAKYPWLVYAFVTVLVSLNSLRLGQYQINDLYPIASQHYFDACLLPYEVASLGRSNSAPSPFMCDLGVLGALLGPIAAQAVFRLAPLFIAGLAMFSLLRRLDNGARLSYAGGLLYLLAPPLMDQVSFGGPGIALTAALLPAVCYPFVPGRNEGNWRDALFAGAALGATTIINPQAPFLFLIPVAPFAIARWLDGSLRRIVSAVGIFLLSFVIASAPVFLAERAIRADVGSQRGLILQTVVTSVSKQSISTLLDPYLFIGVLPGVIGAVLILFTWRQRSRYERAALCSFAALLLWWIVFRELGPKLVAAAPFLGLFRDEIKFQILLSFSATVLAVLAVRILRLMSVNRRSFVLASLCMMIVAFAPAIAWNRGAVFYGEVGPSAKNLIPVSYAQVLRRIGAKEMGDRTNYRILWLPQDQQNAYALSVLDPQSLVYRDDLDPSAKRAILDAESAIVGADMAVIAPRLGQLGVKYVALNKAYRADPDAPWQSGSRMIASIGSYELLAGSPKGYYDLLQLAQGLRPVAETSEYIIYENTYWTPITEQYAAISDLSGSAKPALGPVSADATDTHIVWKRSPNGAVHLSSKSFKLATSFLGQPITPHWQLAASDAASAREPIRIVASRQKSWTLVSGELPVIAGQSYFVSGDLAYQNAVASHIRIQWIGSGSGSSDTVYVVAAYQGTGTIHDSHWVTVPPGSTRARIQLLGGWRENVNAPGSTTFRFSIRPGDVAPSASQTIRMPGDLRVVQREFPGMLFEPLMHGSIPQNEVPVYPLMIGEDGAKDHRSLRLLTQNDIVFHGPWGKSSIPGNGVITAFKSNGTASSYLTVPYKVVEAAAKGARIVWSEFGPPNYDPDKAEVRSVAIKPNIDTQISCRRSECVVADIVVSPPLPRSRALVRVARSFCQFLVPSVGQFSFIRIPGDWATIFTPASREAPNYLKSPERLRRLSALLLSHIWVLICIPLGLGIAFRAPGHRNGA